MKQKDIYDVDFLFHHQSLIVSNLIESNEKTTLNEESQISAIVLIVNMKPQFCFFLLLFVAFGYSRQIPTSEKLKGDQGFVEWSLQFENEDLEFSAENKNEGNF